VRERSLFSISAWTPASTRKPCLVKSAISADCFLTFSRTDMRSHKMLTMDRMSKSVPDLTLSSGVWQASTAPPETFRQGPCADDSRTWCWFNCRTFLWRDLQVVVFDVLGPCSSHNFLPKGHTAWLIIYLTVCTAILTGSPYRDKAFVYNYDKPKLSCLQTLAKRIAYNRHLPRTFMLQSLYVACSQVRNIGAFNNEVDLKCLASTYPSGKKRKTGSV